MGYPDNVLAADERVVLHRHPHWKRLIGAVLVLLLATPWCAVGLVALPLAVRAAAPVRRGLGGRDLIPVLRDTGLTMLAWSVAVALALTLG